MTIPTEETNNPYSVPGNRWHERPRLLAGQRLRFAPHGNPISWRGAAGLAGLLIAIRDTLGPGESFRMAELGSFNGESGAMFAGSGMFEKVWLIDNWGNRVSHGICEYNMRTFGNKVEMIKGNIDEVVKTWEPILDCIYIDGTHTYDAVTRNLSDWVPFVSDRGVICGHDYNPSAFPGVVRAIDEFFPNAEIKLFPDTSWLIQNEK